MKKSRPVCLIRPVCLLIYRKNSLLYVYSEQTSIRDTRVGSAITVWCQVRLSLKIDSRIGVCSQSITNLIVQRLYCNIKYDVLHIRHIWKMYTDIICVTYMKNGLLFEFPTKTILSASQWKFSRQNYLSLYLQFLAVVYGP